MNFVEENLGYTFQNQSLLQDALRHSSIKRYARKFERLEFLGDRVLGLVIAEYIYEKFKKDSEGDLARMQSMFVCAEACYEVAKTVGLNIKIQTAGRHLMENKTVLADAMEAVLGAVFLDSGFDTAKIIVLRLWKKLFKNCDLKQQDPKTHLQEICQERSGECPKYSILSVTGPDHNPIFKIQLKAFGLEIIAEGSSKKIAEISAAQKMLELL